MMTPGPSSLSLQGSPHVPISSFIGRDGETRAIVDLMREDGVRLITLTGPGGVGKTRLALRAVNECSDAFPDGIAYVSLALIVDPALVLPALAKDLGLQDVNAESLGARLRTHLGDKQLLLVLDNFEQVIEAALSIAELLAACPRLSVLVTSRIRLRVSGEREYPVPPLALPGPGQLSSGADWSTFGAVRLFVERATSVQPDFALSDPTTVRAVVDICRRLDGLPLAIELAAARIKALAPGALLSRLEPALPMLTGGARDLPARQQTMRNAIAWSYELLSGDEQRIFRRLGVFVGGFTLAAAESVARDTETNTLDMITSLVDASLLRRDASQGLEPRYLMLETVREFAAEQLDNATEGAAVRARHASYFADLAERASSGFYRDVQDEYGRLLSLEDPNFRAAAAWALRNEHHDFALRIAISARSYTVRFQDREALHWLESSLSTTSIDPRDRADALWAAATMASSNDPVRGGELAAESRMIAAHHGDRLREAKALNAMGVGAEWNREFDRATEFQQEALTLLDDLGNEPDILGLRAFVVCNLADAHLWRHQPKLALPLAEEAIACWRGINLAWAIPFGQQTLGAALCMRGDQAGAARCYGETIDRRLELDDRIGLAGSMEGVAGIAVALEQLDEAASLLGAAQAIRTSMSVRYGPHWLRGVQVRERLEELINADALRSAWEFGGALSDEHAVERARRIVAEAQELDAGASGPAGLSPREREVLALIVEGRTNVEIGNALFISPRTVQNHVTSILGKFGVASRTEAATRAVRDGMI